MFPPDIAPKDRPFYSEFLYSISNYKFKFENFGQPAGYMFTDADIKVTHHLAHFDYSTWFWTLFGA
jgi:hypothetical protein